MINIYAKSIMQFLWISNIDFKPVVVANTQHQNFVSKLIKIALNLNNHYDLVLYDECAVYSSCLAIYHKISSYKYQIK